MYETFTETKKRKLLMRISMIYALLLMGGFQLLFALDSRGQNLEEIMVKISTADENLEYLLKDIELQTDLTFAYLPADVRRYEKIVITPGTQSVKSVLDMAFSNTELSYQYVENSIIIFPLSKKNSDLSDEGIKGDLEKNSVPAPIINVVEKLTTFFPFEKMNKRLVFSVAGQVTDEEGEPLIGVNIQVKGSNKGTSTDFDGNFSLEDVDENAVLVVSYVGYQTQEVPVAGKSNIEIIMISDSQLLDEVVVVGYGTQKKVNLTGAVSAINEKQINAITSTNLVSGLAGKLPGLKVQQISSEPGAYKSNFSIRGYGSPLIIVDGIVRDDFNKFDPNEIESISIIKDATAAIYGVQAANGVILVTTKKGVSGKPRITYSGNYMIQSLTNNQKGQGVGSSYDWAVLTTESEIFSGTKPDNTTFTKDDIQNFQNGKGVSTDWLGLIYRDNASVYHHNIQISGGKENIRYFTSLGFQDEMGVFKSGDLNYKRYNVRSSVTGDISDNLSLQLNIDGIYDNKNQPGYNADAVYHYTRMNIPTFPVYANSTEPYLQNFGYPFHPLAVTNKDLSGYSTSKIRTFQGNLRLDYKVGKIKGLTLTGMFGYFNLDQWDKTWLKSYKVYDYDEVTGEYIVGGIQNSPPTLNGNYFTLAKSTLLGQINYSNSINNHNIGVDIILEGRHEKTDNLNAKKEFEIEVDQFFAGVSANSQVNSGNIYEIENQSLISRINYNYREKYLVELGFNYGGSSKFPSGKRWGFFPYTSLGWRISEENFLKDNYIFIDNLKIRASWGKMGDDNASSYQFLTGFDYPVGNYVFGDKAVNGLGFRSLPNPNITWFTAETKNFGVDFDLFNGAIFGEFEVFQRDRSGLLATRALSIPGTVGASLPQENLNSDRSRGFEMILGHRNKFNSFMLDVSGNFSFARTMNRYIERTPDGNSYLNWRNNINDRWQDISWGYKYVGQFKSFDEIFEAAVQDGLGNSTLNPGDLRYEDINGDGIINELDMIPISSGNSPNIYFGLNFDIEWKQFEINFFFQGASNYNQDWGGYMTTPLRWGRNSIIAFNDRWHHEDIFDVESPLIPGHFPQTAATNIVPSNQWPSIFWKPSISYLRLKSMEVAYNLNVSYFSKIGIENFRLFINGFNLYTFTNVKYTDPERPVDTGEQYPITRNINFGVNITF